MYKEVTVAEHAGFCFGVKRATDRIEECLAAGKGTERVYTLGHLIHNDTYNATLRARGVEVIGVEDIRRVADSATEKTPAVVFVRAHGIPREVEDLLRECASKHPFFRFEDCTCPYVKKIHGIAAEHSGEDSFFILIGSPEHPEVVGIMSYFDGEKAVFPGAEALKSALCAGQLGNLHKKIPIIAAQTTQNLAEWEKSQKVIKNLCTNARIFDTICSVTEIRQLEAKRLADACDFVIVIGGKESSNTSKLYAICKDRCDATVWVEGADELRALMPLPHKRVGIVAGASTPGDVIQEVYKTMSEKNFAELLEESLKTLNTGDTVTGYVTNVTESELQLDLGAAKVTGIIKAEQITDDPSFKIKEQFKIGDAVEAFVIRVSDIEGVAELSKKRVDADKNWIAIVGASESGEVLEGKVVEVVKGGVVVLINSVRVFVPAAHTGVPRDGDLNVLKGQTVKLKVIEIRGRKAVGSIRLVLRDERIAKENAFWESIEEGKVYTGTVKSLTSYGAFVDLGGVDGMVHVSELSWKRIKNPAEVVKVGDEITVFIKSFDAEKKRISLGYKTEATNPWFLFKGQYAVGDVASVKIVNMMPFGAFAEIIDDVDGLIHISQIALERIKNPSDVLELGQIVDAKIIEIDDEKQKVGLSIRALLEEAAAADEASEEDIIAYSTEDAADAE